MTNIFLNNLNDLNNAPSITTSNNSSTNSLISKLFYDPNEKDFPVVSVIFTFYSGCSYDKLYSTSKQQAPEGTRVACYQVDLDRIDEFYTKLTDEAINDETFNELREHLNIEPDCVLFNFECCSGCQKSTKTISNNFYGGNISKKVKESMQSFGFTSSKSNNNSNTIDKTEMKDNYGFLQKNAISKLLNYCITKGYYVMFGDFSVKAIINDWDDGVLGPNPFVKLGECNNIINLTFDSDKLKECESNQMRIVGELCRDGKASVHCMSGTIVFGLDKISSDNSLYKVSILTKAETNFQIPSNSQYKIDDKYSIGHASLKYSSGSLIFFSSGHWIDLKDINVDLKNLKKVVESNLGVSNSLYSELISYENMNAQPSILENSKNTELFGNQPIISNNNISNSGLFSMNKAPQIQNNSNLFGFSSYSQPQFNPQAFSNNIASKYIQQTSNCNYSQKNQMPQQKKKY
jgi:hypothetical protein